MYTLTNPNQHEITLSYPDFPPLNKTATYNVQRLCVEVSYSLQDLIIVTYESFSLNLHPENTVQDLKDRLARLKDAKIVKEIACQR